MRVGEADAKRGALWKHAELSLLITLGLDSTGARQLCAAGASPFCTKAAHFRLSYWLGCSHGDTNKGILSTETHVFSV